MAIKQQVVITHDAINPFRASTMHPIINALIAQDAPYATITSANDGSSWKSNSNRGHQKNRDLSMKINCLQRFASETLGH